MDIALTHKYISPSVPLQGVYFLIVTGNLIIFKALYAKYRLSEKPAFLPVIAFLKLIQVIRYLGKRPNVAIPKIILRQQINPYMSCHLILRKLENPQLPAKKQVIKRSGVLKISPYL